MAKKHSWLRSQIAHFPDFPVQNMIVAQAWGLNMQNTYLQETKIHGHVWGLWHLRGALKACTLASYRWEWVGCNVSASPPNPPSFPTPCINILQAQCSVQCTQCALVHRTSCRLEQGIEVLQISEKRAPCTDGMHWFAINDVKVEAEVDIAMQNINEWGDSIAI